MTGAASPASLPGRIAWFRWKAIIPLVLFLSLVVALWILFADRLGKLALEKGGTAALGAKVQVDRFHIALAKGQVDIGGMTVASPFDSLKNLYQADELVADIALSPLFERKAVIDQLKATGLRFGTTRTTNGIVPSKGPSATSQIMDNTKSWAAQPSLQVPVLQLATGKLSIDSLDPRRLSSVQEAQALTGRADSSRKAWAAAEQGLDVKGTADSARALAARLQKASPTDLNTINDARKGLDRVKQTRDRLAALQKDVTQGVKGLQQGVAGLEEARQRDYATARSLVKLPPIDATSLGWVLFGPAAVEKFQRALYYTQLARHYMPPGLMPREDPAPARVRMAGTNVRFPKAQALPGFLLREAQLSFFLGEGSQAKAYNGMLRGLNSDPALYGKPTTLDASAPGVQAGAMLDHVHAVSRDTLGGVVQNVTIPDLRLPSLGIRLSPGPKGAGSVGFGFAMVGDSLHGRWSVSTDQATWARDSGAGTGGQASNLVWQVISGIQHLDVTAELGGTLNAPRLNVHSNLDKAVADRVQALVGDQVKAAEAKLRAQVDAAVSEQIAKAKAQVSALATDATKQLGDQQGQLDQAQKAIQDQLARLTGGIHLP